MTTLEVIAAVLDVPVNAPAPTFAPRGSRFDLPKIFGAAGFTRGAEIGVWKGAFAEVLCTRVPGLSLLCVDPYESYDEYNEQKNKPYKITEAEGIALDRLRSYACDFIRERSVQAAKRVPDRSLDFVYIDGNHAARYVLADLEAWTPKVRVGGIVSGHDYGDHPSKPFIQVKPAVDAFTAAHRIAPWFVLAGDKSASFLWVVS